jgi:hypothetical protein
MAAIGVLTAIIGFFSFFLSSTSVVDPLQFPVIHSRVAAIFGIRVAGDHDGGRTADTSLKATRNSMSSRPDTCRSPDAARLSVIFNCSPIFPVPAWDRV